MVTTQLLKNLNISDSCLLHGDNWHLLNKVFPDTFKGYYSRLHCYLHTMLNCKTENELDNAYKSAKKILREDAEKWTELNNIYKNPSYSSKFYMNDMFENLGYR